ncbi:MAG: hypothetical protein AAFX05_05090 [Planctomycetota bacterium]
MSRLLGRPAHMPALRLAVAALLGLTVRVSGQAVPALDHPSTWQGILGSGSEQAIEVPPRLSMVRFIDALHESEASFRDAFAGYIAAAEPQHGAEEEDPETEAALTLEHHEEHWRNRFAVFIGATTKSGNTHLTIGAEYERRLSDLIGIGVVAEGSPGGREFVAAVPVFFHPVHELVLSVGPGFAVEDGHAHFLIRLGIGWEFEVGDSISLAPTVSYDLVEGTGDAVAYGLTVSFGF